MIFAPARPVSPRRAHRSRLVVGASLAVLVAVTGLGISPDGAHAATTLGASVTFYGRGYGHGVGMAQYGALGRANAGLTAATILAHYYQGTTPGTIASATPIRVLVLGGFAPTVTAPLVILGKVSSWSIDGQAGTFPASAQLALSPPPSGSSAWPLTVTDSGGTVLLNTTVSSSFRVRPADPTTQLELVSKPSYYDTYRGILRVVLGTTAVNVVNELGMDDYLRGVVPSEMPSSWPSEALASQTIASRSYAAYHLHPSTGSYDVYDDTSSQVYRGILGERSTTDAIVASTAGAILLSSGAIVDALYHSSDGGATENNQNVFTSSTGATGTAISYLQGSSDLKSDDTSYDAASPWETWQTATYSISTLSNIFKADSRTAVGTLTALDLSHRGVSGRLIYVVLYGTGGSKQVSGGVFTSVFNARRPTTDPIMRSTLFDLVPIGADFAVSASPSSQSVKQGGGVSYSITLSRLNFSSSIDLAVTGLAAGATATLTPTSTTGTSATLSVTTSKSGTITPVGTYPLTITGVADGLTRSATATLVVTDGIAPTVTTPRSRLYALTTMGYTATPVRTSWSASDPSGIAAYVLERSTNGGSWSVVSLPSATSVSLVQPLTFGYAYRYVVRATDGAGNTSGWAYGPTFKPLLTQQSSSAVAYSGTWTTVSSTYASGGSLKYATAYGASATYSFTGASVSWVAYRGPNRGSAAVYIDGSYKATISLYAANYYSKQIVFAYNWTSNGSHTIRIVCLGTSGHPRVDVDAFVRLYLS